MKKKLIFLIILIVAVTGFIFSNSLKNSEESNASSGVIVELLEPFLKHITDSDTEISFLVRKGAHLAEFFLLGFVVLSLAVETKKVGFAFFYVLMVAVTDEFIQSFSDRTSSVSDVIIDFTGAMIGFATFAFISYCITKLTDRKKN